MPDETLEKSYYNEKTHGFCPQCGGTKKVFTGMARPVVENGKTTVELKCAVHGMFNVPEDSLEIHSA
jgi:nitrogen fixation protein FixH